MIPGTALRTIKAAHTIIWAFFVLMIGAIWGLAWEADFAAAAGAIAVVLVEVAVLGLNHGQCPFGRVVARYTDDRSANFDIYLPVWLASRTKLIFGTLYGGAILFTALRWVLVAR
jgi:hypothetical protein